MALAASSTLWLDVIIYFCRASHIVSLGLLVWAFVYIIGYAVAIFICAAVILRLARYVRAIICIIRHSVTVSVGAAIRN
jgi:hypothetical protein